jgi:hypothetical protein
MTFLRIVIPLYLLIEHDLFGKPVTTFPDHALTAGSPADVIGGAIMVGRIGSRGKAIS